MRARPLELLVLGVPVVASLGVVLAALGGGGGPPPPRGTGGVGVVLRPLEGASADARTVVTRAGEVQLRRSCEAGRCELLAGDDHGYRLLASYPAERTVDLRAWPDVELVRVLAPREPRSPPGGWFALVVLLSLGLVALCLRGLELRGRLRRLGEAREGWMSEDGELRLAPGGTRVLPSSPLPPGPALALRRRGVLSLASYREAPLEVWEVLPGSLSDHLVRLARELGEVRLAVVCVLCADLAALALRLASGI